MRISFCMVTLQSNRLGKPRNVAMYWIIAALGGLSLDIDLLEMLMCLMGICPPHLVGYMPIE